MNTIFHWPSDVGDVVDLVVGRRRRGARDGAPRRRCHIATVDNAPALDQLAMASYGTRVYQADDSSVPFKSKNIAFGLIAAARQALIIQPRSLNGTGRGVLSVFDREGHVRRGYRAPDAF
ncbi:hypothetical protein GWI33_007711 [Rhynchophorus ferrugineus]|uniref:Uncharacterized protein n=1 Tax=Rhynchophorus ferrugineus TaxID=354439 RepID=A0A834IFU9_RHYFE|nr:hypothetical protein GWI33_007711 [Rhynchophorus ferrugineus]